MMNSYKNLLLNIKCITLFARYSCLSQALLSSPQISSVTYYSTTNETSSKWTQPKGYDTGIKIYNPITKTKVPFIISNKNYLKWYACGPTVYDSPHIGHALCNLRQDILRRILENYFNINTIVVSSITDIDDKIIKKANELKEDYKVVAKKYELEYFEEMEKFGIIPPTRNTHVSEFIPEILDFIKDLVDSNKAYQGKDGSIYFDTEKFPYYFKLWGKMDNTSKSTVKKSPFDFALWKHAKENEPYFNSKWCNGRPGWHIECSTMATHFFGSSIDLHTGGIDLKFPHHENEEAQSCSYHNKSQWVNYWLHFGHLRDKNGTKMSKSLGNYITTKDYLQTNNPNQLRMVCLITPYSNDLDYNSEILNTAKQLNEKFKTFVEDCNNYYKGRIVNGNVDADKMFSDLEGAKGVIHESLVDNFNTPRVIDTLITILYNTNIELKKSESTKTTPETLLVLSTLSNFVSNTLSSLGLNLSPIAQVSNSSNVLESKVNAVLDSAVKFRTDVRKLAIDLKKEKINSDPVLKKCDDFRNELSALGITIKDQRNDTTWHLK